MKPATLHHQQNPGLIPLAVATIFSISLCACVGTRPLKGGKALTATTQAGIAQILNQAENPAQPSRQDQHTTRLRTYTVPQASRIEQSQVHKTPSGLFITNLQSTILSAPTPVLEREETHASTELGASQKDTARELGAKLASLKPIVWLGLAMFIFGIASLAWPPLRALVGSVTTSAAITLGGLALTVLPTLIVGNEILILGGVALVVGAWFLAHRHGQLRGALQTHQALSKSASPRPRTSSSAR